MTWLAAYLAFGLGICVGVWLRREAEKADQAFERRKRAADMLEREFEARARRRELNGQVRERLRRQGMGLDMPITDYAKQLGVSLALMEDQR